jgi:hypothetical protein
MASLTEKEKTIELTTPKNARPNLDKFVTKVDRVTPPTAAPTLAGRREMP